MFSTGNFEIHRQIRQYVKTSHVQIMTDNACQCRYSSRNLLHNLLLHVLRSHIGFAAIGSAFSGRRARVGVKTAFSFAKLDNLQSRALSLTVFYPRSLAELAFLIGACPLWKRINYLGISVLFISNELTCFLSSIYCFINRCNFRHMKCTNFVISVLPFKRQ